MGPGPPTVAATGRAGAGEAGGRRHGAMEGGPGCARMLNILLVFTAILGVAHRLTQ